ncbi:MAG: protein kinase [Myxococcota bacterium]
MSSTTPPPTIAGYEVTDLVGRGSMGTVYAARPADGGDAVALKVLRHEVLDSEMGLVRFERELDALRRIEHPGVTRVFDTGQLDDGRLYLTMELLEGKDLDRRIDEDAPSRLAMLERVHEALGPLAAAHEAGIIHRDLKPENVFLLDAPRDGQRVKLLDFGIARDLSDDAARKTATGVAVGSPAYMSPEQAAKPRDVGPPTDVWSVGVMLYELLSGELPYDGESPTAVLLAVCTEQHRPLEKQAPRAHPKLAELVERCLHKRPDMRPANGAELAKELGALLADPKVRATLVGEAATPLGAPLPALEAAAARFDAASPFDTHPPPKPPVDDAAGASGPSGLRDSAPRGGEGRRRRWGVAALAMLALGGLAGAGLAASGDEDASAAPMDPRAADSESVAESGDPQVGEAMGDLPRGDAPRGDAPPEEARRREARPGEEPAHGDAPALARDAPSAPAPSQRRAARVAPERAASSGAAAAAARGEGAAAAAEASPAEATPPSPVPAPEATEPAALPAGHDEAPPVDAPPVDAPPVDAPPVEAPPVDSPPVEAPREEAAPERPSGTAEPEPEEAPERPGFVTF